jgi:hydroxyacylglutathione hydrolase
VLADARARIVRYTPEEARADPDLLLVDTRSLDECERDGAIAGARHIPLSVVPWRSDELAGSRVCLICTHGYSSSLAAALLVELGVDAGDLIGGFEGWAAAQ